MKDFNICADVVLTLPEQRIVGTFAEAGIQARLALLLLLGHRYLEVDLDVVLEKTLYKALEVLVPSCGNLTLESGK